MRAESLISIHAPRVGSDLTRARLDLRANLFQSTLPVWGATEEIWAALDAWAISIHAPRVGSDDPFPASTSDRVLISIHAPRVGSDILVPLCAWRIVNFNPRSPCGERPFPAWSLSSNGPISIHAPRVGSDYSLIVNHFFRDISIHAPRVGSDLLTTFLIPWIRTFQSTLPVWGATVGNLFFGICESISIHAPRVGSDHAGTRPG